jgi:hypothetical protein
MAGVGSRTSQVVCYISLVLWASCMALWVRSHYFADFCNLGFYVRSGPLGMSRSFGANVKNGGIALSYEVRWSAYHLARQPGLTRDWIYVTDPYGIEGWTYLRYYRRSTHLGFGAASGYRRK